MAEEATELRSQLASAKERASAAEARADALAAQLSEALRLQAPAMSQAPAPAPAPPRAVHRLLAELARHQVVGPSPSKSSASESYMAPARGLACYEGGAPLSPALASLARPPPALAAMGHPALFEEHAWYPLLSFALPPWIPLDRDDERPAHRTRDARVASTLFDVSSAEVARIALFSGVQLPWTCRPELLARVRPWHPPFTAEAKFAESHVFEELAVYAMLGMLKAFFSHAPEGHATFFTTPPVAYGLAAFPYAGHIVGVEWVGRACLHIASEPFFLGTPAHAAAVAGLPDHSYEREAVHVDLRLEYAMEPEPEPGQGPGQGQGPAAGAASPPRPLIAWSVTPQPDGRFRKIVSASAYEQNVFRRMHAAYAALGSAREAARGSLDPAPPALLEARLLFGAGAVCVEMAWAPGADAEIADLAQGGAAVAGVAAAIAWLARRGLLYLDLRPPNVRVQRSAGAGAGAAAAALVDYDDVVRSPATLSSYAALRVQLAAATAEHFAASAAGGCALTYLDAFPALAAALQDPAVQWEAEGPEGAAEGAEAADVGGSTATAKRER